MRIDTLFWSFLILVGFKKVLTLNFRDDKLADYRAL